MELVDLKDFADHRQVELEVNLYPGSYIVVPRTTGCTIPHPAKQDDKQKKKESQLPLFTEVSKEDEFFQRLDKTQKRTLTPRLESVISEIFNKFDIGHKKYLTYEEFKAFNKVITEDVTSESQFKEYLKRYQSTGKYTPKPGMTLLGLKMFFFEFIRVKGQTSVWVWDIFQRLGYDEELQSVRSRSFTLSLHSSLPLDLKVQDAL